MDGCECDSSLGMVLWRAERLPAGFGWLGGFECLGNWDLFGLRRVSVHDWGCVWIGGMPGGVLCFWVIRIPYRWLYSFCVLYLTTFSRGGNVTVCWGVSFFGRGQVCLSFGRVLVPSPPFNPCLCILKYLEIRNTDQRFVCFAVIAHMEVISSRQ